MAPKQESRTLLRAGALVSSGKFLIVSLALILVALVHSALAMKFIKGLLMGAYLAKHHNPVHPIHVVMMKKHG